MKLKTKDYDKFIFRPDNREKIDQTHVERIRKSIEARNLLELRPIIVNERFEIIDGQHRLLAAKKLGVEIYYQIEKELQDNDIILMNTAKAWKITDFFNYYCKNNYVEYLKLKQFMEKQKLSLKVATSLLIGRGKNTYIDFKEGKFVFPVESLDENFERMWDTINYIKKANGVSLYTNTIRFWRALSILFNNRNFDYNRWNTNLKTMIERFQAKVSTKDYLMLFMDVHNYRSSVKVNLTEEAEII